VWHLKGPRRPPLRTLRVHRAGSGHALQRAPQPARGPGEHPDHANLREAPEPPRHARRSGPEARRARTQVRSTVQDGLRRDPRADDAARSEAAAAHRLRRRGGAVTYRKKLIEVALPLEAI